MKSNPIPQFKQHIKLFLEGVKHAQSLRRLRASLAQYGFSPQDKDPVILVFINSSYIEILRNWVCCIRRLNIEKYLVIAMDSESYQMTTEEKINSVLFPIPKDLSKIWQIRLQVFRFMLKHGYDFIHSDADAVWLKEPVTPYFHKYPNLDLIASQGTCFPMSVFEDWRFVLCCGFFSVRSNPKTRLLFSALARDVLKTNDDQVSLNQVLKNMGLQWEFQVDTYTVSFKDKSILCSPTIMIGSTKNLKVGVLPFKHFPRLTDYQDHPFVSHPRTGKNINKKIEDLKQSNLWFLSS